MLKWNAVATFSGFGKGCGCKHIERVHKLNMQGDPKVPRKFWEMFIYSWKVHSKPVKCLLFIVFQPMD